jgi:predicted GIY-YIG superfamily endonuclease
MAFYAYLLRCRDGSYYAGHSDNLEGRIYQHQNGLVPGYTHGRRPLKLVWCEAFTEREEAKMAEHQIKGWSRAKKEALIAGDWTKLVELSRSRPSTGSGRAEHGANSGSLRSG